MFSTEVWERFSYYGMRAILYYYLTDSVLNGGLAIPDNTGLAIVSIYGASVYLLSVLGGWVADRLVGGRKAVLIGGVIIMAGHLSLAVPGVFFTFLGLIFVALGTGLLKPNVSSVVGELYDADDTRRDSGFSIFYMGVNLGAFFAPIVVGILRATLGYHAGFAAAAIGMGLALIAYVLGRRTLRGAGEHPTNPLDAAARAKLP
jgi:POT family proton-dependent oligopeptide transporter